MVMRWVGGCVAIAVLCTLVVGCGATDPDEALEDLPTRLEDESLGGRGSLAEKQGGTLGLPGSEGPLEDIYFGYDSEDLDSTARQTLQRHHRWLDEHREARIEIEGHCDERGSVEYNLALGARRAAAAKSYLVALGVSPARITTISYGEELPLCKEATEACWRRNRRGHFVVFGQ